MKEGLRSKFVASGGRGLDRTCDIALALTWSVGPIRYDPRYRPATRHRLARNCSGRTTLVDGTETWSFAHPTIADALTSILKERPHFIAALLRGASIEAILGTFVCESMRSIQDAPTIPAILDDVLVARLSRIPNEMSINWLMFRFLAERASDKVFERVVVSDDELLRRDTWGSYRVSQDPKVLAHARAHRLGWLDEYDQSETTTRLREAALRDFDLSFFEEEDILRLIPPSEVISLAMRLRSEV